MEPRLFLVDSFALAFRSHYAFIKNPLINSKGQHTSALFGYANYLIRLILEAKPTHLAVVKDLAGPTFRHDFYPDYKAQRKPMPEELVEQIPRIDQFIHTLNLPCLSKPGYEADDLLATLALQGKKQGYKVFLCTKDKDLMQIVDEDICLFELGTQYEPSQYIGPVEVEKKYGVPPQYIGDLLALMGDSSDNIPGVPKVGQKTAQALITQFGGIDSIYQKILEVTPKGLQERLVQNRDKAQLSQKLVQLDCGVQIDSSIDSFSLPQFSIENLQSFIEEFELHSLKNKVLPLGKLNASNEASENVMIPRAKKGNYRCILPGEEKELLAQALQSKAIAIDTETTGLDTFEDRLVGLCLSYTEEEGLYFPCGHVDSIQSPDASLQTNFHFDEHSIDSDISFIEKKTAGKWAKNQWKAEELVDRVLKPLFNQNQVPLVFHNAKFDLKILSRYGILSHTVAPINDTLLAAYVLNPGKRGLSLDELVLTEFNYNMMPITQLIGPSGNSQKCFSEVSLADATEYGAEDADFTLRLWNRLYPQLKNQSLYKVYSEMELPLLPVLLEMENQGISIESQSLEAMSKQLETDVLRLENQIKEMAGKEFNVASTQQLADVLYNQLELKSSKKTKTGFSTDSASLQKLRDKHPIIPLILDFRELTKLKNTYVDVLPTLVHPKTKRIHTSFSQTIAATGRLSSINPNLQNIPIRTEAGKKIRQAFIAKPGYQLLAADYSQIELRILAHLSEDPTLIQAYQQGTDIHAQTASALYEVPLDQVTSEMRRSAKVVNFGVLYGMGPHRLSAELEISREKASNFIKNYFATFSKVNDYMQSNIEFAQKMGYVETITGRRRSLPEILSQNRLVKENAERMATNTPIQGSAADLIKLAMISIHQKLNSTSLNCQLLLQVHDELVFEVKSEEVPQAINLIQPLMEGALPLRVPLQVELGYHSNWLEAHG